MCVLVLDATEELHKQALSVLSQINEHKKGMVVANKADNEEREWAASEFYQFGLGEVYPVSSTTKRGFDALMAALVDRLPGTGAEDEGDRVHISLVGKPNVGKSSLVNATLGFDRAIVTETPGTTRDTVQ